MTKAFLFLVLTFLSLLFSGCTPSKALPASGLPPYATVSSSTAEVGEFVEVTVKGGYALATPNEIEEETIPRAVFGLCFIPSDKLITSSEEVCESLALPGGLTVANDKPLSVERAITVRKGEVTEVTHDIKLTTTEAKGATVVGYYGALDENGKFLYIIYGIEEERAFITFQ